MPEEVGGKETFVITQTRDDKDLSGVNVGRQRMRNGQIKFGADLKKTRMLMFIELYCVQCSGVEGKLEGLSPGMRISKCVDAYYCAHRS